MCNQGGSGPPQPAVQRRLCSQPQRCLLSHSCWLLDTFCQTGKKRKKKNNAEFSPVLLVTLSSPLPEFIFSWQPWVEVHPSRGFFSFYEDVTLQTDGTFHFKPAVSFSLSGWLATHLVLDYRYFLGRIQAETFFHETPGEIELEFPLYVWWQRVIKVCFFLLTLSGVDIFWLLQFCLALEVSS